MKELSQSDERKRCKSVEKLVDDGGRSRGAGVGEVGVGRCYGNGDGTVGIVA
jgi:hypothetical protein